MPPMPRDLQRSGPRRPFRSSIEGPAEAATPPAPGIGFATASSRAATDRDVLFAYQIFLGRNPENSFVIATARTSRLCDVLTGMLQSTELLEAVARPLAGRGTLRHEQTGGNPSPAQLAWLREVLELDEAHDAALGAAAGWRELWRVLAELPDFPRLDLRGTEPAAAKPADSVEAAPAEPGFAIIHIDQPKPNQKLRPGATLQGGGWAIAPDEIATIEVRLGDRRLAHAKHGLPRPDVARNFPHYPNVDSAGFAFAASIPEDWSGEPGEISVRVETVAGEIVEQWVAIALAPGLGERAPDTPIRLNVEQCDADASGGLRLSGWAVAQARLAGIEIHVGSRKLGDAKLGLARPDIARLHAAYPGAAEAGFVFAAELGEAASAPISLRVRAVDVEGRSRQVLVPVTLAPVAVSAAAGPALDAVIGLLEDGMTHAEPAPVVPPPPASDMRLEIDAPALEDGSAVEPIRGAFTICGWAVARPGMESVELFCDGERLGAAHLGTRREDVARIFPDHEGALLAGWSWVLRPGTLAEGEREIRIVAKDRNGTEMERGFRVWIEPSEMVFPGSTVRQVMRRAEIAFGLNLLQKLDGVRPFRVLLNTDGADDAALKASLQSLAGQTYPEWRLSLPATDVVRVEEMAREMGLAERLAPHLELDSHERVIRLRSGDALGCDALLEFATAHGLHQEAGLVYADEACEDLATEKPAPFFKPDWSPELLLGHNYLGRAWSATADALSRAGLGLAALAKAGDLDAVLRVSEAAGKVVHVPKILMARGRESDRAESERQALARALRRRGIEGDLRPLAKPHFWRVARRVAAPRISIVMPTCGGGDHVRRAIPSIRRTSAGHDVEIVILDNAPPALRKLKTWLRRNADIVVPMPDAFNWSRFNNVGAKAASGDVLLFLNDDVEALDDAWLAALLEQALCPEVGIVGAKLLYPGGRVQHAGQFLAEGHARHAFRFADENDPGPFGLALPAREVSAVTGACMAMRREIFDRLGGFDESHSVVNNDLDFCLRAREAGLAVIYTPHAVLRHHELASRAGIEDHYDEARFHGRWRLRFLEGDPYHGSRLLSDTDHFAADPEPALPVFAGPEGPSASAVRRILAVKLDHIGDYLTAVPALRSLKRRFPSAQLTLLAPPATASLARAEPAIDEIEEFSFFHARSSEGAVGLTEGHLEALAARLAPARFDMAIDLRMQPETRDILRYTGAPFLVGYDHGGKFPWLTVALEWEGDTRLVAKRQHVSERLLQLVAAAEAACEPLAASPLAPLADPASVPALAKLLPPSFRTRPLVCVHPGVGNPVRQWPPQHFADLVDLLVARVGVHAILVGGPDEQAIAEDVLSRVTAKDAVISLAGRTKLAELRDIMRACVLFVGNNSGPKHLAASLGVPTLGIHSAVVDATEWGPLGAAAFALRREMVCAPCYLEFASDCPRAMACLTGIRPRDAFAACLRLLGMRGAPAGQATPGDGGPAARPARPAKSPRRKQPA